MTTRTSFDQASRPVDTFRTYPVLDVPLVEVALASYAYDAAGNVASVTDHLSGAARATSFGYDAAARLRTITRPNGVVTTNDYSATRGWLDKVTHAKTAELTSTAYTRSPAGRVSTETTPDYSRTFTYDGAGRLSKTVEGSVTRNYSFDANSNRCSTGLTCDGSYVYDDADRITASPFGSGYGYDSHGNLTSISSSGAAIAYDGWDHATSIKPDTATAATVETLAPSGRVIRRLEPVLNLPVIDTAFGYAADGDSPSYSGPVVADLLVLAPLTITSYISGPGGLLNIDTGGTASWPLINGHGDIVGTTDAAGIYTANPVTDEFGVGDPPASRLGYLGGAQRYATGGSLNLIRMGVRLYDAQLGRFLQVDPIGGGSANAYDYVNGDPCNANDIGGLKAGRGECRDWFNKMWQRITSRDGLMYRLHARAHYRDFGSVQADNHIGQMKTRQQGLRNLLDRWKDGGCDDHHWPGDTGKSLNLVMQLAALPDPANGVAIPDISGARQKLLWYSGPQGNLEAGFNWAKSAFFPSGATL